jgi:hypothetical protein
LLYGHGTSLNCEDKQDILIINVLSKANNEETRSKGTGKNKLK